MKPFAPKVYLAAICGFTFGNYNIKVIPGHLRLSLECWCRCKSSEMLHLVEWSVIRT